jgi:triosephosphate isomerase
MMRKKFMAGNWKLNKTIEETEVLVTALVAKLKDVTDVDIAICPTFLGIPVAVKLTQGTPIKVGGQNLFWEMSGAYTGEISGPMLKASGCEYVIIGHSERRQYFGETNQTVNKRIQAAVVAGLKPIFCVGETLAEREAEKTFDIIKTQVVEGLAGFSPSTFDFQLLTIAYEPVWAIGTGKTATKEQAQEVHAYIRKLLADAYGKPIAEQIRIQYGGSVKPENARELMSQPDIDGALIGGASLKADDFVKIVKF